AAPPDERGLALDSACAGDPELRREVEQYLRYESSATARLPPLPEEPAPEGPAPERVGPWHIVREIGRGGMGVVYQAERDDGEYRQCAALKLVRDSRQGAAFRDLFRRERQILAQLEHPNIARLLDGGTTPEGQPYYVMEYVEDAPLLEYCGRNNLPVGARLRLFLKICDAVSYAHRRLIIHGDLKPGNMLVAKAADRGAEEPKLLDFGLAKVLQAEAEGNLTATGMPLLTPIYASPEQVRGERLTTATDIYSLGVVLYELLTGGTPYALEGPSLFGVWNAICEQNPPPPSTAAGKGRRYRAAADLDAIVLKMLRKEPDERYASVEALVADLERYLAGMPVLARGGNALYRLRRLVVRRKWPVAAGVAALMAAAAAFSAIWWEQQRAQFRFQQLRQFARSVVFEIYDSIEELPGATPARKLLVARSLEYLRSLDAASRGDLTLRWDLAEAYKRVGDAQGNSSRPNLGDSAGALAAFTRARRLLREILAAQPDDLRALSTLVEVDRTAADTLSDRGATAESLLIRREASEILNRLAALRPTLAARRAQALGQWNLALGLTQVRDWPGAAAAWQQALALYEDLTHAIPEDASMRRNLALSHKRLAAVYLQQGDTPHAIEQLHAAEQIDRARLAREPASIEAMMDLSYDLSDLGLALFTLNRYPEAVRRYEEALELRRSVAAQDPQDYRARTGVGRSLDRLALAYQRAGNLDRAIENAREATETLAGVTAHDPANQQARKDSALAFARLGWLHRARAKAADWRPALAAYQRATTLLEGLGGGTSLSEEDRRRIATLPAELEECRRHLEQQP
ncbi:MAG: serine/threonine-protein kinase, partial [Candidatus Solibacter sp.]|nr:serine/threonine-protein kinase [Candidatus Solibacter sp.]